MIEPTLNFIQLLVSIATLITLAWGLLKMFEASAEARAARAEAMHAAKSAEHSAKAASQHAVAAVEKVVQLTGAVEQVVLNTNGMSSRLEKLAGEAGEERGRQLEREKEQK